MDVRGMDQYQCGCSSSDGALSPLFEVDRWHGLRDSSAPFKPLFVIDGTCLCVNRAAFTEPLLDNDGTCLSPGLVVAETWCENSLRSVISVVIKCWKLVEKDTVFQRLETPDFCERYRCILVTAATAKGQPNVSTRMFVQSLRRNLQIPVFALVDCNPSVFIIMSAYRHGAETRAFENHRMAVPDLKWIGLHPTEVEKYNISNYGVPLTIQDVYNCKRLLKKQCVNDVPDFKRQLEHMLETNRKYQIEALGTSETSLTRRTNAESVSEIIKEDMRKSFGKDVGKLIIVKDMQYPDFNLPATCSTRTNGNIQFDVVSSVDVNRFSER
ncbi:DNA topoisomerase 6 subunit A [Tanacetum coccineum]